VQAIYAPYVAATPISFELVPPAVEEMARRIEDTLAALPWLVLDEGAGVVGYAYASAHRTRAAYRWSVDVSVYVAEAAHRRGVGRALYGTLLRLLVLQGYYQAYAGITLPNRASVALHEALGFRPLAVYQAVGWKLGAWHDVGWWHRPLKPLDASPGEPLPLYAVRDGAAWREAFACAPS
jgi:phosphinothricin acetyltransferase